MASIDGYTKHDIDCAISTVFQLAERKHQDECYEKECLYCYHLSVIAKHFDGMEQTSRVEAYKNYDEVFGFQKS